MLAGASSDQVAIDDDVAIDVFCPISQGIAVQVVVSNQLAVTKDADYRSTQPEAMADDPLEDLLVGKCSGEKRRSRRNFVHVFGVTKAIGDHARGNDDRIVRGEFLVA